MEGGIEVVGVVGFIVDGVGVGIACGFQPC